MGRLPGYPLRATVAPSQSTESDWGEHMVPDQIGEVGAGPHFRAWSKAFKARLRSPWWSLVVLVVSIVWGLLKDRMTSWANATIDAHATGLLHLLAEWTRWLVWNPLGATFLVALLVVLALAVHAYWESRHGFTGVIDVVQVQMSPAKTPFRQPLAKEYRQMTDPSELELVGDYKAMTMATMFGELIALDHDAYAFYSRGDVNDKRRMRQYIRDDWKWDYSKDELVKAALGHH